MSTVIPFYRKFSKTLPTVVSCGFFLLGGLWLIVGNKADATSIPIGWMCLAFFGFCFVVALSSLFDRRPQLVISENGIWERSSRQPEVKWEQIVHAETAGFLGNSFVCLKVDETFKVNRKIQLWSRSILKKPGSSSIDLPLSDLGIQKQQLLAFIEEMRRSEKSKRTEIIRRYFSTSI